MKLKRIFIAATLALVGCLNNLSAHAQPARCQPPIPPVTSAAQNIFSAQQEMDLGDAVAEHLQSNFHVIDDAQLNARLRETGARLVAQLPDTGLRYQFFLFDQPIANAFTLPGGRIYVSRKSISTPTASASSCSPRTRRLTCLSLRADNRKVNHKDTKTRRETLRVFVSLWFIS